MPHIVVSRHDAKFLETVLEGLLADPLTVESHKLMAEDVLAQLQPTCIVVRQITYTGTEAAVREQLARSMPEGLRDGQVGVRILVETRSSNLE